MKAASGTGEKLPLVVIGKSKSKNVKSFQEREVFTMHVPDTRKKLNEFRNLQKMDQTAGSKIFHSEL